MYPNAKILMASNLGKRVVENNILNLVNIRIKGELKIVFISRIVKKKNLFIV